MIFDLCLNTLASAMATSDITNDPVNSFQTKPLSQGHYVIAIHADNSRNSDSEMRYNPLLDEAFGAN